MPKTEIKTPAWLTADEALERLECSLTAFRRLVDAGAIRSRDFGHRRYWAADVERLANPPETNGAA